MGDQYRVAESPALTVNQVQMLVRHTSDRTLSPAETSTAADERHLRRHDRHELNVGVEWQRCHVDDSTRDVLNIERRLALDRSARLKYARPNRGLCHVGRSVADVDLPAGDIEFASVKRG